MALDEELLGTSNHRSLLERSGDWEWDLDQYPEYSAIESRNGYYSPSEEHTEVWPTIRPLHFESISKAANHRALDPRTQLSRYGHRRRDTVTSIEELKTLIEQAKG